MLCFSRLGILMVFITTVLLGLPFWWMSTTVYRVELPYNEINSIGNLSPSQWPIYIDIVFLSTTSDSLPSKEITKQVEDSLHRDLVSAAVQHGNDLGFFINTTSVVDQNFLKSLKGRDHRELDQLYSEKAANLASTLPARSSGSKNGYYTLFINLDSSINTAVIGQYRSMWIECKSSVVPAIPPVALRMLTYTLFYEKKLDISKITAYRLTFSLLNEDPISWKADWDFPALERAYLKGFTEAMAPLYSFHVDSQVVHHAKLKRKPLHQPNTGENYFIRDTLPHFVDINEWKLGGGNSANETTLHFGIFLPSSSHTPLVIKAHPDGPSMSAGAFTTPHWGGIVIHNRDAGINSSTILTTLHSSNLKADFAIIISQIRQLVGLPQFQASLESHSTTIPSISVLPAVDTGVSHMELDALSRYLTHAKIKETQYTLASFADMVSKMTNIPVYEAIVELLHQAISFTISSVELAQSGQYDSAYLYAKQALVAAESAFFHQDMVGMLYFPDKHQLAVYVPLFLPMCFPLISGIRAELKRRKSGAQVQLTTALQ